MTDQISTIPSGQMWDVEPAYGFDVRGALCAMLVAADIAGIETVRLLPSEKRHARANHKVFFVLATHDIVRDERIIQLMMQFEGVDYDLVPSASADMIPGTAVAVI